MSDDDERYNSDVESDDEVEVQRPKKRVSHLFPTRVRKDGADRQARIADPDGE